MKKIYQGVLGALFFLGFSIMPVLAEEVEPTEVETVEVTEQTETEPMVEPEQPEVEPISEQEPEVLNGWQENNTKYYVDGKAVNGVQTIDKDVYYFENESLNPYTGFVKNTNNNWIFVRDGKSDWTFTGVAKSVENGKWYHAEKGVLNWGFTGLSKSVENGKWYFSRKGALDWSFTGVAKSIENGKWYHAKKGALDWGFTGVSKSVENGRWYHSKNGRLDWSFTGLSKSVENGKWYFSRKGALDWNFTGVAKSVQNGKWYHVKKGRLDWNFTGISKSVENGKYYYSKKGTLDWGFIGRAWNIDQKRYRYVLKGKQIEDRTLERAADLLWQANGRKNSGWTLKAGYDWVITHIREQWNKSIPKSVFQNDIKKGTDYIFNVAYDRVSGKNNAKMYCYHLNGVVYQMSRVLGYNAQQVEGYVINSNNGKDAYHSWCEIKENGKTIILDADLQQQQGLNGWKVKDKKLLVPGKGYSLIYRTDAVIKK